MKHNLLPLGKYSLNLVIVLICIYRDGSKSESAHLSHGEVSEKSLYDTSVPAYEADVVARKDKGGRTSYGNEIRNTTNGTADKAVENTSTKPLYRG